MWGTSEAVCLLINNETKYFAHFNRLWPVYFQVTSTLRDMGIHATHLALLT